MNRKTAASAAIAFAFGWTVAMLIGGVPGLVAAFIVSGIVGAVLD